MLKERDTRTRAEDAPPIYLIYLVNITYIA